MLPLVELGLQLPTEPSDDIAHQSVGADLANLGDSQDPRLLVSVEISYTYRLEGVVPVRK